jgi:hypothetical protein
VQPDTVRVRLVADEGAVGPHVLSLVQCEEAACANTKEASLDVLAPASEVPARLCHTKRCKMLHVSQHSVFTIFQTEQKEGAAATCKITYVACLAQSWTCVAHSSAHDGIQSVSLPYRLRDLCLSYRVQTCRTQKPCHHKHTRIVPISTQARLVVLSIVFVAKPRLHLRPP